MQVTMIKTGESVSVSASYGARLIEQGKAVAAAKSSRRSTAKAEKGEA